MDSASYCCSVRTRCRDRRLLCADAAVESGGNADDLRRLEANVTDPDNYKSQFLSVVVPKLKQNNIKYLAVGGKTQTAIGDEPKNRIVLTEGSMDDQMAFCSRPTGVSAGRYSACNSLDPRAGAVAGCRRRGILTRGYGEALRTVRNQTKLRPVHFWAGAKIMAKSTLQLVPPELRITDSHAAPAQQQGHGPRSRAPDPA